MRPHIEAVADSTPVLVGVGTAGFDADPLELMAEALRRAALDATGEERRARALLRTLERVAVPQGTWRYANPGRQVAARVGAGGAKSVLAALGIPQQTLVNQALSDLAQGRLEVCAVVGGEARGWARRHGVGPSGPEDPDPTSTPDWHLKPARDIVAPEEVAAGLVAPVTQYAMIENALRAAEGLDLGAQRARIDALWARFNEVARRNPEAAFAEPKTAADLASDADGNRLLAFPYRKWHASQWTVDQAGALVLCSAGAARRLGVDPAAALFPLVGVAADHAVPLSRRRLLHRWPAMAVLGHAASSHLGRPLRSLEVVEVYSCFPAAVQVQQRELSLPLEGTPTVTGGMAFAGGPLNNFVLQATAAVARRLRQDREAQGLVTTVSGLLTKPGLGVWSSEPSVPPLLEDFGAAAAAATEEVEVQAAGDGPADVATYTVVGGPSSEPEGLVALLERPDGRRLLARSTDRRLAEAAMAEELVGQRVEVRGTELTWGR